MILKEAYHNLVKLDPVPPNDPLFFADLYREFCSSFVETLSTYKDYNRKILLPAHHGSGKSTILLTIASDPKLIENFYIVFFSISELMNPDDFHHIDLLVSMAVQAAILAEQDKLIRSGKQIPQVEELGGMLKGTVQKVRGETKTEKAEAKVEVGAGASIISWLSAKFFGQLQASTETRTEIRREFKEKITDLLDLVNGILRDIQLKLGGKRILFLVDDTDKAPLRQALEVFEENGLHISKLQAGVVFPVDMALACSSRYRIITGKLGGETIPAIKVLEKNEQQSDKTRQNRKKLRDLLHKRISEDLIDEEALEKAVEYSGGIVREAIRLLLYTDDVCLPREAQRITETDVDHSIQRIRNDYSFNQEHWRILKEVLKDPYWKPTKDEDITNPDSAFLDLLYNYALMEYRNEEDRWRRPHPVLIPALRENLL